MISWEATSRILFVDGLGGEILPGQVFSCEDYDFSSNRKDHTVSVGSPPNQRFRVINAYDFLTRSKEVKPAPVTITAVEAEVEPSPPPAKEVPNPDVLKSWVLMMEKFFGSVKSIHNNGRSLSVLCDYSAQDWNALRSLNKSLGVELASIESVIPEVRQLGEGEKDEGK